MLAATRDPFSIAITSQSAPPPPSQQRLRRVPTRSNLQDGLSPPRIERIHDSVEDCRICEKVRP